MVIWTNVNAEPAGTAPVGDTVMLPPFVIEGDRAAWCLARAKDLEILSLLSAVETRQFANEFLLARDAFNLIIPEEFQCPPREPLTIILWDRRQRQTVPEESLKRYWPSNDYSRHLPNLLIADLDHWTLFCTPTEIARNSRLPLRLTPQLTRLLLCSRKPALPRWVEETLSLVVEATRRRGNALEIRLVRWRWRPESGGAGLPPLVELLTEPPVPEEEKDRFAAARMLFVTWALEPGDAQRTKAFWTFLRRACSSEANGDLFRECFGFDVAAADEKLLCFLKARMHAKSPVTLPFPQTEHSVEIVPPTPQDIARVKGNWLRLAANLVAPHQGDLSAAYRKEGRSAIHHVLDKRKQEPSLLRVLGLIAADEGNATEARDVLERAYAAGATDATVGATLSRLRFATAQGMLDREQLDAVLAPLWRSCGTEPPAANVVRQAAQALGASAWPPRREDVERVVRWTKLFPRDPPLLFDVSQVVLLHGYRDEARELLETALRHTRSPEARGQIEALIKQATL